MNVLGDFLLTDDNLRAANIRALVEIAHYFRNGGKANAEDLAIAKKFYTAAEELGDPEASDLLTDFFKNPLIAEAMWLRAADRNSPAPVNNLQEDYEEQAAYWQKKIAEAQEIPFEGEAPTEEEILKSSHLKFFTVYKRAFEGDLDAMKICLEFCEEEVEYWRKREP